MRTIGKSKSSSFDRAGLLASLFIHASILALLTYLNPGLPPETPVFTVSFEREDRTPQIVSPPATTTKETPLDTKKLSDQNARTEVEQIRRGTGGAPSPTNDKTQQSLQPKQPQQKTSPHTNQQKEKQHTRSPGSKLTLKDLRLDSSTLSDKFRATGKSSKTPATENKISDPSDYKAFARPRGSGATFIGTGGISDHLPNLPDGDITLLNAKANLYASFVRRVAIQVFTQLRSEGWDTLRAHDIRQVHSFSIIEAVLSPEGRLRSVSLKTSSGSSSFDRVVENATRQGAQDPNPPQGALDKDGNIHFIFKARSWTQMGANARSGAPTEYRWLLLATGLL